MSSSGRESRLQRYRGSDDDRRARRHHLRHRVRGQGAAQPRDGDLGGRGSGIAWFSAGAGSMAWANASAAMGA